jgi:hypothetical protein
MRLVKITFLGLLVWLLSLIWPEVNLWLSPAAVLGAIIGLGSVMIGYLGYQLRQQDALVPKEVPAPVGTADTHPLKPVRIT